MERQELTLGEKLEIFVREQAKKYGDVISYVPAVSDSTPTAAVGDLNITASDPSSSPTPDNADEMAKRKTATLATSDEIVVTHHGFAELQEKLKIYSGEPWHSANSLDGLEAAMQDCMKCRLGETRTKLVFGKGAPNAKIMILGEAPGADEDMQGEPFIGRAGQLLTKMLQAIEIEREQVFIVNMLKSRPPNNRDPKPDEIQACEPYLWKQIVLIKPKAILCMGRIAATHLLKNGEPTLGKMRGNVYDFYGVKVMATYHPAALLRNPDWKRPAWDDLKQFKKLVDEID